MTNPVSADEEDFVVPPEGDQKSRYDFSGDFEIEITEAVKSQSKKGNPMAVLKVVGLEGAAEGLQFTDYAVDFRLRNLATALGDKTPKTEPLKVKLADFVGKRVIARFASEEYNGKHSAKIQEYLSGKSSGGGAPLPF
jgi:hypothetical protein